MNTKKLQGASVIQKETEYEKGDTDQPDLGIR